MKAASLDDAGLRQGSYFNEDHLHFALEAAGIGLWYWDLKQDLLTWNDQCKALFGFPRDVAITYEQFLAALHPDDRAPTEQIIQTAIRDHTIYDVEYRSVWPDKRTHWLAGHGQVVYDDSGEAVRMMGSVVDITQRKLAVEHAYENERRWRRLMDSNIIGVVIADNEQILEANQSYLDILGLTRGDLENGGINWRRHTPSEHLSADERAVTQLIANGACEPFEKEYYRKGGSRVPVLIGTVLLNHAPLICLSLVLDLTARKRAEQRAHENDRQLRTLTAAAPAYLFKVLPSLKLEYLTPYFFDFTGYQPLPVSILKSDDNDLQLEKLLHPDETERIRELWRDAAANLKQLNFEFRLRRADGVYRWFATHANPELDQDGRLLCFYGAAFEIHLQKEAEAALHEVDRRKDEFLAMLAHELRNPLTPIANSVELLKLVRPDDQELTRVGEMIGRQTTILTRIVDDLLDVSRITTGKITLQKTPVDLGFVAQEAAEAVKPLVASRWQTLDIAALPETIQVLGDPMRLTQVITNLLNNAAKYSPERAAIRLIVERENDDAVVRVRDTGYGVSADLLPYIFDLFTQAERTPGRSQGGLGIGLTIVRKLTELHGGRVEALSAGIGMGSEFIVRLPLITDESMPKVPSTSAATAPSAIKVLVVDDNPDCAESMAELLHLRGFDTDIARDGAAAVERFRRYRPDIVLLDIGLPDMDGYTVARRIRELPNGGRATLIAVTGYGQAKDRANSQAAGFDQHMVKPVDFSKLFGLIKSVLRHSAEML